MKTQTDNNKDKNAEEKFRDIADGMFDEDFQTCSLKSLWSPVPCTGKSFRREIATFLFHCARPKRG